MTRTRKLLFVDRDGTLIVEPPDKQVDTLEKLRLMPDVIPALLQLRDAGYAFVIVTNQDGLGTSGYPRAAYDLVQASLIDLFASQGIRFEAVLVCPHFPDDACLCRKPHLGLVRPYLGAGDVDLARSAVVGDRETDLRLADNMGLRGFRVGSARDAIDWRDVARVLISEPRRAERERRTNETQISVAVDLDAPEPRSINTGIAFFDHMLDQLAKHGGFALTLYATGDLAVEAHHTVEDVALALGDAVRAALGDKRGIARFGFLLPMDEARAEVALDLSGRAHLVFDGVFPRTDIGGMPTEMVPHFFRSLCDALGANLHVTVRGDNTHHMIEAIFKAVGRALRQALSRSDETEIPSTKGVL